MRAILSVGTVLLVGCAPVQGPWSGRCEYPGPKGNPREASLAIELEAPENDGIGKGSARVTEGDATQPAKVVYRALDDALELDLYLDDGDELFLRGTLSDDGVANGRCGSPTVEQFSLDSFVDCVAELDVDCDAAPEWSARKGEPAPVERRDLDGDFRLARD